LPQRRRGRRCGCHCRLGSLRLERDELAQQLGEAQQRLALAEAERAECRARLEGERGTALTSLGEFQRKQEEAVAKAAQAERDLRALQERFRCGRLWVVQGGGCCCRSSSGAAQGGVLRGERGGGVGWEGMAARGRVQGMPLT
jgi:hypothetical protein